MRQRVVLNRSTRRVLFIAVLVVSFTALASLLHLTRSPNTNKNRLSDGESDIYSLNTGGHDTSISIVFLTGTSKQDLSYMRHSFADLLLNLADLEEQLEKVKYEVIVVPYSASHASSGDTNILWNQNSLKSSVSEVLSKLHAHDKVHSDAFIHLQLREWHSEAAALEHGAKVSTGNVLLFLKHTISLKSGSIAAMLRSISVVSQRGKGKDKIIGPHVHLYTDDTVWCSGLTTFESSGVMSNRNGDGEKVTVELSPRLQGVAKHDPRIESIDAEAEAGIVALADDCFMIDRAVFTQKFNIEYGEWAVADLCMQLQVQFASTSAVVLDGDSHCAFPQLQYRRSYSHTHSYSSKKKTKAKAKPKSPTQRFMHKWQTKLIAIARRDRNEELAAQGVSVLWNMECGTGQIWGFSMEATAIVTSLEPYVDLRIDTNNFEECKKTLLPKLPGWMARSLQRMYYKSPSPSNSNSHNDTILVIHRDPGRYSHFVKHPRPALVIGRSMYETDSIPTDWVKPANSLVDAIWVPALFNVRTFAKAGVLTPIGRFPESVDTMLFRSAGEGGGGRFVLPGRPSDFKFLAVGKWEARKNWDGLIRAFVYAFSSVEGESEGEGVVLYIRSKMNDRDRVQMNQYIKEGISLVRKQHGIGVGVEVRVRPPRIEVLAGDLPSTQLPTLYSSVDCLVHASHGEGWGLPVAEAMSTGLPVIVTRWSGLVEFVSDDSGIFIEIEHDLVEVGEGEGGGEVHKWAQPDFDSICGKLQWAVGHRDELKHIGVKGMKAIQKYGSDNVAQLAVSKLITLWNKRSTLNDLREKRAEKYVKSKAKRPYRPRRQAVRRSAPKIVPKSTVNVKGKGKAKVSKVPGNTNINTTTTPRSSHSHSQSQSTYSYSRSSSQRRNGGGSEKAKEKVERRRVAAKVVD